LWAKTGKLAPTSVITIFQPDMSKKAVMSNKPKPKLLDEVRQVMRRRHYSIHTERTCCRAGITNTQNLQGRAGGIHKIGMEI